MLALLCLLAASIETVESARAEETWARVQQTGEFVWGGDQEGGGPYILGDPDDPGNLEKLRGFEVELATMLAEELGKAADPPRTITARFRQGDWLLTPQTLGSQIDVALNGYELTPERQREYLCSRPYYVYGLQLLARSDSPLKSWDDVKNSTESYVVGVLNGTGAQTYLEAGQDAEPWKKRLEPLMFDGTTQALEQVAKGQIPLTLTDDCAAIYYAERYPSLKFVGRPVSQGYYVMLVERGQDEWLRRLNAALGRIIADGRLTKLYDRWNMSGQSQTLALRDVSEIPAAVKPPLWELIRSNLPVLLQAAGITVLLACVSMPLAILLGIAVAIGRLYGPNWLKPLLAGYVEFLRGTPLLLQLYALFFLLPELLRHFGIDLEIPAFVYAIIGLAVNYSAYEAEIYRAGLQAVPRGQLEAALALGMTRAQAILRIVLPQAFRIVIPPVTNDFIALFKDTSVCSVITVVELTKRYSIQANSTGAFLELAVMTSILYLLMSYPLSLLARYAEKRTGGLHVV